MQNVQVEGYGTTQGLVGSLAAESLVHGAQASEDGWHERLSPGSSIGITLVTTRKLDGLSGRKSQLEVQPRDVGAQGGHTRLPEVGRKRARRLLLHEPAVHGGACGQVSGRRRRRCRGGAAGRSSAAHRCPWRGSS
eukprot:3393550-Rhodomonas_salina.1